METFGNRLKQLRKLQKLTQSEVAKFLNVTTSMISMWEHSICEPALSHIKAIALFFDVKSDYLIGTTTLIKH